MLRITSLIVTGTSAVRVSVEANKSFLPQGCPDKSPCPGGALYCLKNGGCYGPGQPGCPKESLCGHKEGSHRVDKHIHVEEDNKKSRVEHTQAPAWNPPSGSHRFQPIDTKQPPGHIFEAKADHYMPPRRIVDQGNRHQTNKFWTNWISGKQGDAQKPVFSMPYSLKWSSEDSGWKCHYYDPDQNDAWCRSHPTEGNTEYNFFGPDGTCGHCHCCSRVLVVRAELMISHLVAPSVKYATGPRDGRIAYYISRFTPSYSIGIKETSHPEHYKITKEGLLGVHAVVRGMDASKTVRFPVYRGMSFVSAQYSGLTPRIDSPQGFIKDVVQVRDGVFDLRNSEGDPDKMWECAYYSNGQTDAWCKTNPVVKGFEHKFFGDAPKSPCGECDCCRRDAELAKLDPADAGETYRVYVMDNNGNPIGGRFANTSSGLVFDRPLHGWIRMAHIIDNKDAQTLDKHVSAILEGVKLHATLDGSGRFGYDFETSGNRNVELLHWGWIHQRSLMKSPNILGEDQITHIRAPTKGAMLPILGRRWEMQINVNDALNFDLLPHAVPRGAQRDQVISQLRKELEPASDCYNAGWPTLACESFRIAIFTNGFYNNGKGLQKLGTLCLLGRKLLGNNDPLTKDCTELLKKAYECHYNGGCSGVPYANYDQKWGGIASKQGFTTNMCGLADFGNACYNDHHYHYGYFIHAGAILLSLKPEMRQETNFVTYVNSLVRDISNPSTDDKFFPQFRAFDWYDLHSWSHGVTPSADGKDEESTSEDLNAYFGITMWAKLLNFGSLEHTGAMMLSLLAHSARNLFLMKDSNQIHPADYVKNKVTGIFFEAKVHYGTFFGADEIFIHGIQMIPLTPALRLARSKEFCQEEWQQILSRKAIPGGCGGGKLGWDSLIITGNIALHDPNRAFGMLQSLNDCGYDKGLSKSWAMYWTASIAAER